MFADYEAEVKEATVDETVADQKSLAKNQLLTVLADGKPIRFSSVVTALLEPFMLRETNVKDICVELAKAGKIENTWGNGNRKPQNDSAIKLTSS